MERYFQIGIAFIAMAAFVPALVYFFLAFRHFIQMLGHFGSGRSNMVANFLPFLAPFMPQLFTEQGNVHRVGFLSNMARFLCCLAFIAMVYGVLGIQA